MLVSDLLHSCANARVAAAAVSSIGGGLAARVQIQADQHGIALGVYASRAVRDFAFEATERDWRDLMVVVRGHDHPVLAGLEAILERKLGSLGMSVDHGMFPVFAGLPTAEA